MSPEPGCSCAAMPSLYQEFNRAGIYLGLVWTTAAIALLGWRLVRSTAAVRGLIAPVVGAGCVYLRPGRCRVRRKRGARLFCQTIRWTGGYGSPPRLALVLLAAAVAWSWLRARRTRTRLARLVVELAEAPSPGRLEQALARSLGDPGLRLSYPLADGRYIDADGRAATAGRDIHSARARRRRGRAAHPQTGPPR